VAHSHEHSHGHGHAHGAAALGRRGEGARKRLWWALGINLVFLVVEFAGGIVTGSLALLSDAGHMLTDVGALGLAVVAAYLAAHPPTPRHTFGLLRAEVVGAFLNALALAVVAGLIGVEAWRRFGQVLEIDVGLMIPIAVVGLIANAASAWILLPARRENLNVEGAFLHLAADALGSVGAVVAGVTIWLTGWTPIDLIASLVIAGMVLVGGVGLLRETLRLLLNATPSDIDFDEVQRALEGIAHFDEVRDLHIWSVVSGIPVLTAHVHLEPDCSDTRHWQACLEEARTLLRDRFGIEHVTLQLEPPGHREDERVV